MKIAYQFTPADFTDLIGKSPREFTDFIKKNGLQSKDALKDSEQIKGFIRVRAPEYRKEFQNTSNRRSQILIQPISIEDKSSITGTAAIIEEYAKDTGNEILKLEFDLSDARR